MVLSRNMLYRGRDEPPPAGRPLRAGPLALLLEEGDLRYVRLGDREVVRRLYVAVRDRNWGTVPATLTNLRVEEGADWFRVGYEATHREGAIDFRWHASIAGAADGTIRFAMRGEAQATFLRNRIGFCLLHPPECAGRPCTVEHPDGAVERGLFPEAIAPHQPFVEMRAIAHEVAPDVWAEARFAGDLFEMEDQRNWTDASYKTYCTPLRLPFPVEIAAGTGVAQSVTLSLRGAPRAAVAVAAEEGPIVTLGATDGRRLPAIGLGGAAHGAPLSERETALLRALRPAHLRVDLHLAAGDWVDALRRAAGEGRALGAPLEVALHLSDDAPAELTALAARLAEMRPAVARWLVFADRVAVTPARLPTLARDHLAGYTPGVPVGAGTDAYFTQLNRARPPAGVGDLLCYSINPQVHAFDDASLVETLAAQGTTVESARRFAAGRPIAISPITLRPRSNPDATGPEPSLAPGQPPAQVDPRQLSLFGAGWTAGSLKALAEAGAASVTYYETTGPRGVMATGGESPWPAAFPARPGMVYPLYHVLADLGEVAGGEVVPTVSSRPLLVEGFAVRHGGGTRVVLANLTGQAREVVLRGLGGQARARLLDETTAEEALLAPERFRARGGEALPGGAGERKIRLPPYAVTRIDAE